RDDLKSLAYTLIYLLCGSLPWQDHGFTIEEVIQAKVHVSPSSLQNSIPAAFFTFLEYTHSLAFDLQPDYDYI
ncbi:hypothetical protein PISMIDRAFT_104412, partial [Pisolithus microcarpus 441]